MLKQCATMKSYASPQGPDSEKVCRLYAPHSAKWKTDVESPPVQWHLSNPKARPNQATDPCESAALTCL